jgi:hypothetical protein
MSSDFNTLIHKCFGFGGGWFYPERFLFWAGAEFPLADLLSAHVFHSA